MPDRAFSICRKCGATTQGVYCPEHRTAARDRERERRGGPYRRLYDSVAWKQTRRRILLRDPLCKIAVLCGGKAASTDADHVVRVEKYIAQHGGDSRYFFDEANLQGACHADHARKTRLEEG